MLADHSELWSIWIILNNRPILKLVSRKIYISTQWYSEVRCRQLQKRKPQVAQKERAQLRKERRQQRKVRNLKASNILQRSFFAHARSGVFAGIWCSLAIFFRSISFLANLNLIRRIGLCSICSASVIFYGKKNIFELEMPILIEFNYHYWERHAIRCFHLVHVLLTFSAIGFDFIN